MSTHEQIASTFATGGSLITGLAGQQAQASAASKSQKLSSRSLDIQESELRDRGGIANLILDFIKNASAFDPAKAKAEENRILQTDFGRQQDFLSAKQSLPGGGDPRDTVAAEQRTRLIAAQQDLQIRRNRTLDLDLLTGKLNALLATASLGGIRTPEFGSKSFRKRFAVA